MLKHYVNNYGHHTVALSKGDGKFIQCWVHRLVVLTFIGPQPTKRHEVAHNDGNTHNNEYKNLRWATRQENARDAILHGTIARGERHGCAKLTEARALLIKRATGTGKQIAFVFGCSIQTVYAIKSGRQWAHLP